MPEEELITLEEIAQAMDGCAELYQFAGDLTLCEPSAEQIEQMRDSFLFAYDGYLPSSVEESFEQASAFLADADDAAFEALASDFNRALLPEDPSDEHAFAPTESALAPARNDGLDPAQIREAVANRYLENRVGIDSSLNVPEDHIGVELKYLSVTASKLADALREADYAMASAVGSYDDDNPRAEEAFEKIAKLIEEQVDFTQEHILSWTDALVERVDERASLPVYPALARLIAVYTEQNFDLLTEMLETLS